MNVVDIPTRTTKPLKPKTTSNILHWTEYWVNFSSKSLNSDGNPTLVEWKNKNILIFLLPLGWSTSWSQVLQFIDPSKKNLSSYIHQNHISLKTKCHFWNLKIFPPFLIPHIHNISTYIVRVWLKVTTHP